MKRESTLPAGRKSRRAWHLARCAGIRLADWQWKRLRGPEDLGLESAGPTEESGQGIGAKPEARKKCERSNWVFRNRCKIVPLCASADEEHFVEAMVVLALHKRLHTVEADLPMTDNQLRQIASARHGPKWPSDKQITRLKDKYITRPAKPATRRELLIEISKGKPGTNGKPGSPSVYKITGLERLLTNPLPTSAVQPERVVLSPSPADPVGPPWDEP